MEIKKVDDHFELILGDVKFIINPSSFKFSSPIILTDLAQNLNKDKIFNSAGEYNIDNVYFWGFQDETTISYLFTYKESSFLLTQNKIKDENLKKIRLIKKEIDVFLNLNDNYFDENSFQFLKPAVIVTSKDINKQGFKKEKGRILKINPKKVENLIFVFE